jgi:Zn-dependent M16 (insulinase) family peptidase
MGTEKESFVDLTERIGRKTGGVSASAFVSNVKGRDDPVAFVILRGKAMGDKAGDMLAIMTDVLQGAKLDNQERFKQVRQYVAEVF